MPPGFSAIIVIVTTTMALTLVHICVVGKNLVQQCNPALQLGFASLPHEILYAAQIP